MRGLTAGIAQSGTPAGPVGLEPQLRAREWPEQELSRLWGRIVVVNLAGAAGFLSQRVYLHPHPLPRLLFSTSETWSIKTTRPFSLRLQGTASHPTPQPARPLLATFGFSLVSVLNPELHY